MPRDLSRSPQNISRSNNNVTKDLDDIINVISEIGDLTNDNTLSKTTETLSNIHDERASLTDLRNLLIEIHGNSSKYTNKKTGEIEIPKTTIAPITYEIQTKPELEKRFIDVTYEIEELNTKVLKETTHVITSTLNNPNSLAKRTTEAAKELCDKIITLADRVKNFFIKISKALKKAVEKVYAGLKTAAKGIYNKIIAPLAKAFKEFGIKLQEFAGGIKSRLSSLSNKISKKGAEIEALGNNAINNEQDTSKYAQLINSSKPIVTLEENSKTIPTPPKAPEYQVPKNFKESSKTLAQYVEDATQKLNPKAEHIFPTSNPKVVIAITHPHTDPQKLKDQITRAKLMAACYGDPDDMSKSLDRTGIQYMNPKTKMPIHDVHAPDNKIPKFKGATLTFDGDENKPKKVSHKDHLTKLPGK